MGWKEATETDDVQERVLINGLLVVKQASSVTIEGVFGCDGL
jgi:hypothetical protein